MSKAKTYKGDWYTINSIFGNDWARFFCLLGGREAGKSYSVMKWACNRKLKLKDNFKFYWFRLTDAACKKLLEDKAHDFVDPDIARKYNLKCMKRGSRIYTYKENVVVNSKGKEKVERVDINEFATILSCSTFYNTKGVGYFDNEYKGEYFIVLDEMNREDSEANRFDIVYNFVNLLENVVRSTKQNIKVVMIGNTLDEASDILAAFNFIPDDFGRFKLKSKKCVIDYIRPNEKYLERRKEALANILMGDASTFTNEVTIDRGLIVNKRKCIAPTYIIKFAKTKDTWFTVWNGNIIKNYNNEDCKFHIAMKRYLDTTYKDDLKNTVLEQFDARAFYFTNVSTFKRFQKQLKLIKKK